MLCWCYLADSIYIHREKQQITRHEIVQKLVRNSINTDWAEKLARVRNEGVVRYSSQSHRRVSQLNNTFRDGIKLQLKYLSLNSTAESN
jgi:hypothetical protein